MKRIPKKYHASNYITDSKGEVREKKARSLLLEKKKQWDKLEVGQKIIIKVPNQKRFKKTYRLIPCKIDIINNNFISVLTISRRHSYHFGEFVCDDIIIVL